jgi:hypothetical protein
MLRFALSTVVLAGVLATAHPIFADPLATTAPAAAEPTLLEPAWSPSSDATAPAASAGFRRNVAPAGFGWG